MPHAITVSQNRSINVINHVNTVKKDNTVLMAISEDLLHFNLSLGIYLCQKKCL